MDTADLIDWLSVALEYYIAKRKFVNNMLTCDGLEERALYTSIGFYANNLNTIIGRVCVKSI